MTAGIASERQLIIFDQSNALLTEDHIVTDCTEMKFFVAGIEGFAVAIRVPDEVKAGGICGGQSVLSIVFIRL